MVRGLSGQEATGVRLIPGARVDLRDGRSLLLYPKDRAAWSRLTRLLSLGKARGGKGNCWLDWSDVAAWAEGLVAVLLPDTASKRLRLDVGELRDLFGPDAYLALSFRRRPGDFARLRALDTLARGAGIRSVAMGDILYHAPERRPLSHDLQDLEAQLRGVLATKVGIVRTRRGGWVVIDFYSDEELDRLYSIITRGATGIAGERGASAQTDHEVAPSA